MSFFESNSSLARRQDERLLEHNSARALFIWLLVLLFLFGANASLTMYQAFRLHRFDAPSMLPLLVLGILVVRLARVIYRQLEP